jgi:hypothetical protein
MVSTIRQISIQTNELEVSSIFSLINSPIQQQRKINQTNQISTNNQTKQNEPSQPLSAKLVCKPQFNEKKQMKSQIWEQQNKIKTNEQLKNIANVEKNILEMRKNIFFLIKVFAILSL